MDDPIVSEKFWRLIHAANKDKSQMRTVLLPLSREELHEFSREFAEAAAELTDQPYLKYVAPGKSEDGVDDIARWVVSQGKEFYYDVLAHPEKMPAHIDMGAKDILFGISDQLYEERYGDVPYF